LLTLALAAQAEAGKIRGTVVDRDGKPAAGAKVWAAKLGFMEPLETHEAMADKMGTFLIEAEPGDWAVFALRGSEGGQVGWGSMPKIEEGKEAAPVTVRLRKPSKFRGRLFDAETGKPISKGSFALDDARRVEVDAEGRFEAPGLEMGNHEAYPLCPAYELKRILFDTTGRPDAELELKIPKAGRIVGRVLNELGKPIPGATVGLRTSGSIFSGSALWVKCSEDGRFVYDGKPLGKTGRLAARAPGYGDLEREDVAALNVENPTELVFTLRPEPAKGASLSVSKTSKRRTISGTVVGPMGKPVESAVVRWDVSMSSDSLPETKTDAKGAFRLEHVPDEPNVLSVMAKGLAPEFPSIDAGGDRELKIELKAGATIKGRVMDDAGAPIEGVWIAPMITSFKANGSGFVYVDELKATTDRDGRFTLEGMPEGARCDIVAERRSSLRQQALDPKDESKNVFTVLGEGAIRGRVLAPTGKPVRNFRIQVGIPKGSKPGDPVGGYFAGYGGSGVSFTRDDGEFIITGLTADNIHLLTVIAEGFGVGEVDQIKAQSINHLKPAEDLSIKLGLPHSLRVRVFQEGGKQVEGARVTVIQAVLGGFNWGYSDSSWDDSVTAPVNAQGWAEFPALPFDKGTVVVRAKGFSRRKLEWAKDEEEFAVDLELESKLTGNVVNEEGKPVSGARLILSWGVGEMMNVPLGDKDGRFSADGLGSGKYSLTVLPSDGQPLTSVTVTLEPGKTLSKEIRVKEPKPGPPARIK
jgi:hypothetical protein